MPHFKDQNGGLFWLDDHDVDKWKGEGWQQIADAEAESIRASKVQPVPRAEVIRARLAAIDAESIRALRATVSATAKGKPAPAFDANKLEALETEAAALRAELAGLGA